MNSPNNHHPQQITSTYYTGDICVIIFPWYITEFPALLSRLLYTGKVWGALSISLSQQDFYLCFEWWPMSVMVQSRDKKITQNLNRRVKMKVSLSCLTLQPHGLCNHMDSTTTWTLQPHGLCNHMDSTVHGILQARIPEWVAFPFSGGIFPNQGSNPGLPHYRWILYRLSHKGSPRILEWVAYPFSSGSSQPKNRTGGLLHCRWILYQLSYQFDNFSLNRKS